MTTFRHYCTALLATLIAFSAVILFFQSAEAATKPLSFQTWKSQQIVDAKNQVARISNEIQLLRRGTKRPTQGDLPSELAMLDARLQSAKENQRFAEGLEMAHYVAVHLSQFKGDPLALKEAAKTMKPDEMGQLLGVLLQSNGQEPPAAPSPTVSQPIN